MPCQKVAEIAIGSIGCGYDIVMDLQLKNCKGNNSKDSCLIEFDEDGDHVFVLPDGISIPKVSNSIKCVKGERKRFSSYVLSFQQMSEQFNREISLAGAIPSGLFNSMFEFSGCLQKDAANTKTLVFDGVFDTLYSVEMEQYQLRLRDHVKEAVPSTWEPAALARFIGTYGTHIIGGVKLGGKDVICIKQQRSSTLEPADIHERLQDMADKRFVDANGLKNMSEQVFQGDKDIITIYKRRGGSADRNLSHIDWLQTVQLEPDVISMSFIPTTSLLNGVPGCGFLSLAIDLYLRYKPPIQELHQFLDFQLPRQWAPTYSELPLGSQRKKQSTKSLQFRFMGPKLYVSTIPVDVGMRPVTGLRLYLEGTRSNRLAICMQHLCSRPTGFQLVDELDGPFPDQESYDKRYIEKVRWKNYSGVYTAPVETSNDNSIVTGAQLLVRKCRFRNVLFLRLHFSTVLGAVIVRPPEWDGSFGHAPQSGVLPVSGFFSIMTCLRAPPPQGPQPKPDSRSTLYSGGPQRPNYTPELLEFVDTTEMKRGPEDPPGYWAVSGARLVVEKGRIALRVKYSLLAPISSC